MPNFNTFRFIKANFLRIPYIRVTEPKIEVNNITIRGCSKSELKEVRELYESLTGKTLSPINKLLTSLFNKKILIVAVLNGNNFKHRIIGINLYYLNIRDVQESTIHEAFIGVSPDLQGKGIATKMRLYARERFKLSGFEGISSRVSINNKASLNSAKKLGFKIEEKYLDTDTLEERYYLICNLRNKNYEN